MVTWSYFAALLTDPGEVPIGWHPFPDDAVSVCAYILVQQVVGLGG